MKNQSEQSFILKIPAKHIISNRFKLNTTIKQAREDDLIIALADSQVLRWINDYRNKNLEIAYYIRKKIKLLKNSSDQADLLKNRRKIRDLYADLDNLLFCEDLIEVKFNSSASYKKICKNGFFVNGKKFKRLLATNGGVKNSTVFFVNEELEDFINEKLNNDRDESIELVPAKLEAYKALAFSASVPVSMPKGVIVINDCEVTFNSDVFTLKNSENGEPEMEYRSGEITMNASDGYGLMLPSLSRNWSRELGLDYITSGVNTRFSFEKGMVFTFDFRDFAENVAGSYVVRDAWGDERDVRDCSLILTTSMVKLWDSYSSCEDYISKSLENGYTFAITKTCPEHLESERNLNYQFIQSFSLNDDDIEELISPTINEIKEILYGDWRKTVLFLKGSGLNENNISKLNDDFVKALMINPELINDLFVQSEVFKQIKKKIDEAKVGVIKIHGNYSMASGDPYSLCQSMFGLEVTGLLKAGEIYNKYWSDIGSKKLVCFRAPMTCHNNIRAVIPKSDEDMKHWYKYMNACTIFNSWDTACAALNGMD